MSRMSALMYREMDEVENILTCEGDITLDETQAALINAIAVIRRLEKRVQALEVKSNDPR